MGRSRRSSVGAVTFERGGFVLDGGHKKGPKGNFPCSFALLPAEWTFVVAVPMSLKGQAERRRTKFKALSICEELSSKVCRLTLMKLLPSTSAGCSRLWRGHNGDSGFGGKLFSPFRKASFTLPCLKGSPA